MPAATTLSVLKADIGSIGGHIRPSRLMMERVVEFLKSRQDDPVMLIRVQGAFPATGEILSPFCAGKVSQVRPCSLTASWNTAASWNG